MATTLTNLETVRRVLRGVSGPQPLAGTAQRAADAYAAMAAAEWSESGDGPTVPPHHCDGASPMPGDAYRQTWGYDKAARTERSACGAACYSVRLPADALTGEACGVASVSARVFGDRYLECGAVLTAILSADAAPPSWASVLGDGDSTSALLVPTATDSHGVEIAPNKRADTSATATIPVGEPAAAWLHLVLRVADYLAVREAWHEGGAMLDPSTISIVFSRDVEPDDATLALPWLAPELESGADAALSRTGSVFATAGWPSGVLAGLDGDTLAASLGGIFSLPFLSDPDVPFNAHTMARLGRFPDISGRDASGDYAMVGAVGETWSGTTFPWLCGLVMGMRAETRRPRSFRALRMGAIPAAPLSVRVALYLAPETPHAERGWRHATPYAALCAWQALFGGTAASLPFSEGVDMPLSPLAAADIDLSGGHSGEIPAPISIDAPATVIAAVSPLDNTSLSAVRWPVGDWTLA